MKHKLTFFAVVLTALAIPQSVKAYDFSSVAPSGQTLYYNIVDGNAQVTYSNYYSDYPTGNLIIPSTVTYNDTCYSVTTIGYRAFRGCTGLTSVIIPSSVTRINQEAFYNCTSLSSVTIPSGVEYIGYDAFNGCYSLSSVIYMGTLAEWCNIEFGDSGSNPMYYSHSLTINGTPIPPSLVIPQGVTSIKSYAFYKCYDLTSVVIPDGVTSIGTCSFTDCTSLDTVIIGDSVTYIGLDAFRGSNPSTVTFGSNIHSIQSRAFYDYAPIDPVIIPSTVNYIGQDAFRYVRFLFFQGTATGGGATYVNKYLQDSLIYTNSGKTELLGAYHDVHNPIIPSTVTKISANTFKGCHNIEELTIPPSVAEIGDHAFANCTNLTAFNFLATNCMTLGGNGIVYFDSCYNLTTVRFGNNVTIIPYSLFKNCSGITSINIPASVTEVGSDAFSGCTNLAQTFYGGTIDDWYNITWGNSRSNPVSFSHNIFVDSTELTYLEIPSTITAIKNHAFYGCQSINSTLTIPSHITSIGDSAFAKCTGLATLVFAASNCTSANYAFGECTNLSSIIIDSSVSRIPNYTFAGCSNLSQITVNRSIPPQASYNSSFKNVPSYIPIYVPCNSIPNYYTYAYNWYSFTNIVENCETVQVTASPSNATMGSVTGTGNYPIGDTIQLTAIPYSGYRFVNWSNGLISNPLSIVANEALNLTAVFSEIPIYDTLIVHDTTYVDIPYAVHDTTYIDVFVHDTTTVIDTLTLTEYVPVYDTTYINVPVHDTTVVTDTVTLTEYVPVHDTTYINVPVHDTTIVTDTMTLTEYVPVHDTTYINVPVHDTTIVTDTVTLTEYVAVHDTTIVTDTVTLTEYVPVHDTTYINVPIHDTTIVVDTLTLTEYTPVHDTTYINVHDTTYITLTDTVTNTIYDTITKTVFDTITNTIYDTTVVYSTDTLWLHDTVFVHDTVFIYDTIYVGVDEVETVSAKIYTSNGQIVVDSTQGNTVWLYDVNGRILATKQDEYSRLHFDVPASGTYLVKIGNHPARKVVVIR